MNDRLYTQVVHLAGVGAVAALAAVGKLDITYAVGTIGLLVGLALPSPFGRTTP